MKRKEQSVLLAGLLALGLVACSSTGTSSDTASTISSETSGEAAYSTPRAGSTADTGTAGSMAGATSGDTSTGSAATGTSGSTASTTATGSPNSIVTLIEVVPRQGGASSTGAGTMAGAAVGGTGAAGTSGSSAADKVYRVTLRMDDGSTRVVTQESAPSFRTGDRVRLEGGAIQR